MKKHIKYFLPVLALILLFGNAFTAFATDPVTAVASAPFETHQGETFTTTVYIPDNANIVDFDITMTYDTALLSLNSAVENEDIKGSVVFNTATPGEISINYTRTSKNVTTYTPLVDLTFTVNSQIGIGIYDCLSIDKNYEYSSHRLNGSVLQEIDFKCDFSKLYIYEIGDVDLSCKVDIGDATYIRRHLAKIDGAELSAYQLTFADTYYDTVIDVADAVSLQRHLARLDVTYGNRGNIVFYDADGNKYAAKSVLYGQSLNNIPQVPAKDSYTGGVWSLSKSEYIAPDFSDINDNISVYAYYSEASYQSEAVAYYKRQLSDMYYSGDLPTGLSNNLNLVSAMNYQSGYHASLIWSSDCNYVLSSTTGEFNKPTYPKTISLKAKIISYDNNNRIEAEDQVIFSYSVPGIYATPTKEEITDFLQHYFKDEDGKYKINYDVKLISKINNVIIPVEGSMYDNFEVRLDWYQNINGTLVPLSQVKRTTSVQTNDYVAIATFNGQPIGGDGKIYIDEVEVTAIDQLEIKNYIIGQIAANQGTLATDDTQLWNNDTVYGTTVTWETGKADTAYVANNVINLKDDAISGSTLPLNARISYLKDGEPVEFLLSYNLTVSCDNTIIKAPENMDTELYKAIKTELEDTMGYRGDLTSAALGSVKFVNLDLSDYPDISSLRGLSYCTNLRTLNISGLHITDGTMNQIATLSYLEAFIARGCGLDNLSDGGTPTLRNAVNLKLIDLTDNNFTNLNSVFAAGIKYGALREVYLAKNHLTDINALSRAPMMTYLSLADNGLTTEGIVSVANYPCLTYLSLADNEIDSIEALKNMKYLKELRLQNNKLTNINDLRRLVNLELLYLENNNIPDIGFLNSLTKLKVLYVNNNRISDISALTDLVELQAINISCNNLTSLAVLKNYTNTLTEIYAENNKLTDFSFISGASKLNILMLAGNATTLIQTNLNTWLSGLTEIKVLTLSDIRLADLSFLSSMEKLVRLDIANCGINAFSGEISNIAAIADRYATLKVLDISNNDMRANEEEILKLRNVTLLTVLYADNICDSLDAYSLTYSMTELKFISLENCGVDSMRWLPKYNSLVYVDLAGSEISDVDIDAYISNASIKTLKELYLDTNAETCTFANAYRITDFNVKKLSLENVNVGKVEKLPYLDNIKFLNLTNTGLTNLSGDDPEISDMYSIERYNTVDTIDISDIESDVGPIESMDSVKTVYANGAFDSRRFYKDNLHALQRLYSNGITCYLYDKQNIYEPIATTEGANILNLIDDISCDITVASDYIISDNNPYLINEINDYTITWTVSDSEHYEIRDNHLAVKNYSALENDSLTVTATITVYDDQEPVSREFTVNTNILRISDKYIRYDISGYSEQLTRDTQFKHYVNIIACETEGFTAPVRPVEDSISYSFDAVAENGVTIPWQNVITVSENASGANATTPHSAGHDITVKSSAPLGAKANIKINIYHTTTNGNIVYDMKQIDTPVTVVSRTFSVKFEANGGTVTDENGIIREECSFTEESEIFEKLMFARTGYLFAGWYLDEDYKTLFSADGTNAAMPSKDIILYAKWTPHSFNLLFNSNGGSVETESKLVLCDQPYGELPIPAKENYTFNGWYTSESGGIAVTGDSSSASAVDINLYAHWIPNEFTLTYNANSGTVSPLSKTLTFGDNYGTLPTPTRDFYKFDGWYTSASGGTKVSASTIPTSATNVTIYAHWTQNPEVGWVKASDVPQGATVTQRKWTYTLRSYASSGASSLSGWTKYDTQRTSWGGWSDWLTYNPSNGARNVEYRSAYTKTQYHYYRWYNGYDIYTNQHSSSYWLEENWFDYVLPNFKSYENIGYYGTSSWANAWVRADYAGNYSVDKTWSRDIYQDQWRYQDPVYTYYYYKDEAKESSSYPSGSNISNVVEYVYYRAK